LRASGQRPFSNPANLQVKPRAGRRFFVGREVGIKNGATFDPIEVTPIQLISGSRGIQGWAAGTAADSEDTLHFAALSGVRPMIEIYPLEKAGEAFTRMMSGKAQFR
jgi:D-arabinose 1-dehydrogenase-like Zn-dependent alcohol dehydrogenase